MLKPSNLVTYAEALRVLTTKYHAPNAEIAVWLVVEQSSHRTDTTHGQLNTYTKQGEWFKWNPAMHDSHNKAQLARLFLDAAELETFDPARGYGRWLSYGVLVDRWTHLGWPREWVEELIASLADDARQRKEWRFADASVSFDDATLLAFDPQTLWAADPRCGMFQVRQVEESERALGLATALSEPTISAQPTTSSKTLEAQVRQRFAQSGAAAKHEETEQFRLEFLAEWDTGRFKGNKSAAARWGLAQFPIQNDGTFKNWIRKHEKAAVSSPTTLQAE